jgi:class 3 adenylate cyclase
VSSVLDYLRREYNNDGRIKLAERADSIKLDRVSVEDSMGIEAYTHQQDTLRPLFGKSGTREPMIGGHPDYNDLGGTKKSKVGYSVAMFMDIEASTRLGLLLGNDVVKNIKDNIIRTAMAVVSALDGHVHRIMGDAILVFFNRLGTFKEDACIDALNAASVLMLLSKKIVLPMLKTKYNVPDFGIRIGIDYGPDTLWSSYGFNGMEEITATSFYVDVASKLQSAAPRHGVLLGDSIKEMLDLPEDVLVSRLKNRSTGDVLRYVNPNYTYQDGSRLNYNQWVFEWAKYLDYVGVDTGIGSNIEMDAEILLNGQRYMPCSKSIEKGDDIKITFRVNYLYQAPDRAYMVRINTGSEAKEASKKAGDECLKIDDKIDMRDRSEYVFESYAEWRGFHYVHVQFFVKGVLISARKVGVFIR